MRTSTLFTLLVATTSVIALPQGPPGGRGHGGPPGWQNQRQSGESVDAEQFQTVQPQPTQTFNGDQPTQTGGDDQQPEWRGQPEVDGQNEWRGRQGRGGRHSQNDEDNLPAQTGSGGQPTRTGSGFQPGQTGGNDGPSQTDSSQSQSTGAGQVAAGGGDQSSVLSIINGVDQQYGNDPKTWDDSLAASAYDTALGGGGTELIHKGHPGTMGQVLAFGKESTFEVVYYSWLCEKPDLDFLKQNCPSYLSQAGIGLEAGETGHHDILSDPKYSRIGCGFYADPDGNGDGVWACDVA